MKGTLKEARKDAREYMNESEWRYSWISFTRQKGYYFTPRYDSFSIFFCN